MDTNDINSYTKKQLRWIEDELQVTEEDTLQSIRPLSFIEVLYSGEMSVSHFAVYP